MIEYPPLPQLTAVKPRVGLQRLEDLVRCLVLQYQVQSQVRAPRQPVDSAERAARENLRQRHFEWFASRD